MRWECRIHVIVSSISLLFAWIVLPVGPLDFRTGTVSASTQIEYSAKRNDTSPLNKWQVKQWVQQLGHPSFRKREEASHKLKNGGLPAATALVQFVGDELEVKLRVVKLLSHLLKEHDPPDKGVSVKTLAFFVSQEPPALYRWAMKALARRHKDGCQATKGILRKLCKSRNKEVAQAAIDVLYPLATDRETKRLVDVIAQLEDRIKSYRRRIEETKRRKDLGELSRNIDIDSYQAAIEHNEVRLRYWEAELLKRRMQQKP